MVRTALGTVYLIGREKEKHQALTWCFSRVIGVARGIRTLECMSHSHVCSAASPWPPQAVCQKPAYAGFFYLVELIRIELTTS